MDMVLAEWIMRVGEDLVVDLMVGRESWSRSGGHQGWNIKASV